MNTMYIVHYELCVQVEEYFGGYECHCDSNCVYTMYTMNSVFRLKNTLVAMSATVMPGLNRVRSPLDQPSSPLVVSIIIILNFIQCFLLN